MTSPTMRLLDWARQRGLEEADAVSRALVLAQQVQRGRYRLSGDPYISHCVEVALILAEHDADPDTVVTAILHKVPSADTPPPADDIEAWFGPLVARLLVEFSVLHREDDDRLWQQADRRVLQIKLADRVHNMRTIRHLAREPQRWFARHSRELIAPLARSLGLADLGMELDRLSETTLRSTDSALLAAGRATTVTSTPSSALRSALHAGAAFLPPHCRERWKQDWDGELHACTTLPERLAFVGNVLLGLPLLARETRRTDRR